MLLQSIAAATNLNGHQIQRSLHKIGFKLSGGKAAATKSNTQFLADLALVYVSLKRVSTVIGEKIVWPRMTLKELFGAAMSIQGYAYTTGTTAAVAYTGGFYMELNIARALLITGGDYLELNVENAVAGLSIDVIGLSHKEADNDHLRIERYALAANEFKTIPAFDGKSEALKVLLPTDLSEARVNCPNPHTLQATSFEAAIQEYSTFMVNAEDGGILKPTLAPIDADGIQSIDCTNGAAATSVLVLREQVYN